MHYAIKTAFGGTRSLCGINHRDEGTVRLYGGAKRTTNLSLVTCTRCVELAGNHKDTTNPTADRRKADRRKFVAVALLLVSEIATADPIECFDASKGKGLSDSQRVRLCAGATSNAPIECFDASKGKGLTDDQRVTLCAGAKSPNIPN